MTNVKGTIVVFSAQGAGKSKFLNDLAGSALFTVHDDFDDQSSGAAPTMEQHDLLGYKDADGKPWDLTLVEAPGFQETGITNHEVLSTIVNWLKDWDDKGRTINGYIWLFDLSRTNFTVTAGENLKLLENDLGPDAEAKKALVLCGNKFPVGARNAANKWSWDSYDTRYDTLVKNHWSSLITEGATAQKNDDRPTSVKKIVDDLLKLGEIVHPEPEEVDKIYEEQKDRMDLKVDDLKAQIAALETKLQTAVDSHDSTSAKHDQRKIDDITKKLDEYTKDRDDVNDLIENGPDETPEERDERRKKKKNRRANNNDHKRGHRDRRNKRGLHDDKHGIEGEWHGQMFYSANGQFWSDLNLKIGFHKTSSFHFDGTGTGGYTKQACYTTSTTGGLLFDPQHFKFILGMCVYGGSQTIVMYEFVGRVNYKGKKRTMNGTWTTTYSTGFENYGRLPAASSGQFALHWYSD